MVGMTPPDVFHYAQYRRFIEDWYAAVRPDRPQLSHRALAKRLGSSDPSLFVHLIAGKRSLAGVRVEPWVELLELEGDAADYFRALVAFEDAPDQDSATRAWARLAEIRARRTDLLGQETFDLFSAWYVAVVRELVALPSFREDPSWIAAKLDPPVTVDQAAKALEIALRIGLLGRDASGRLVRTEPTVRTPNEVAGLATWRCHAEDNELMARALAILRSGERPGYERETLFLTSTVAIPTSQLSDLRQEIFRLFFKVQAEADGRAERGDPCDRVVLFSLGLIPVTDTRKE